MFEFLCSNKRVLGEPEPPPVSMPVSEVLTFQDSTQVWRNSRLQREDENRPLEA